jgi:hypothetical protein
MSLRNAAIFLFAAAIASLLGQVIRNGYFLADVGVSFYTTTRNLLFLLALGESVIYLILGLSYKNEKYNPVTRKVAAVLLCVNHLIWIVYCIVGFADRVGPIWETPVDYLIWTGLIVLMGASQLMLAIMIALGKTAGIRMAALPAAIITAAWALFLLYHQAINYYRFGWDDDNQLRHMAELMTALLPVAAFCWILALCRSGRNKPQESTSIIDQL